MFGIEYTPYKALNSAYVGDSMEHFGVVFEEFVAGHKRRMLQSSVDIRKSMRDRYFGGWEPST
mgnify:CR=1 FL=1